jgi:hypothetical protein
LKKKMIEFSVHWSWVSSYYYMVCGHEMPSKQR